MYIYIYIYTYDIFTISIMKTCGSPAEALATI